MNTDLMDLTDEELLAQWAEAREAWEKHYAWYRAAAASLTKVQNPPLDEYNAIRADLTKTAIWRCDCDKARAHLLVVRDQCEDSAAKRDAYGSEWERRGNEVHYPKIEAMLAKMKKGGS